MDDTPAKDTPGDNINKLDLSALEAFQFGTQWTESADKRPPSERGPDAPHRGPGEGGPSRRDRRPPRRSGDQGDRRGRSPSWEQRGPRPDRVDPERRERFGRGERFERGGPRRPSGPPRPYLSPVFELTFYPDDHGFNALVKAMRASSRTYELFEIARLILGKIERCVVVFRRRRDAESGGGPLFISVPDGMPFPTEEEAVSHALAVGLEEYFTTETVEVEPPKGNFQFVNRCPITKDLLGPPNYHRYPQILQQHYTVRGIQMPFERYKASIEVVRDPEAVATWLESMKQTTRYTYKGETSEETSAFDNVEDARTFLLRVCRDRVVRSADTARVPAKTVEAAGSSEAARAMHGVLEMQRRFPLDTANALRGRLRRENFHIFKRGSKGVTFVCSVRRKFRQPGQVFSESINRLIDFLEKNPQISVSELAPKMLGFEPPPAPTPPPPAPVAEQEPSQSESTASTPTEAPAEAAPELTSEQRNALNRLAIDLRWLVAEGYVAEYSDGRLLVHPVAEPSHSPAPQPVQEKPASPEATETEALKPDAPESGSGGEIDPASKEPAAEPPESKSVDPEPESESPPPTAEPDAAENPPSAPAIEPSEAVATSPEAEVSSTEPPVEPSSEPETEPSDSAGALPDQPERQPEQ